jgi:hypothetical protein
MMFRLAATRKVATDPVSLARFDKPVAQLSSKIAAANIIKQRLLFWPMYRTRRLKLATTIDDEKATPPLPPPPRNDCSAIDGDDDVRWWRVVFDDVIVVDDVLAVVVVVALLGSTTACRSIRTVLLLVAGGHRPAVLVVVRRVEDDSDDGAGSWCCTSAGRLKAMPSQANNTTRTIIQLLLIAAAPPPPLWHLEIIIINIIATIKRAGGWRLAKNANEIGDFVSESICRCSPHINKLNLVGYVVSQTCTAEVHPPLPRINITHQARTSYGVNAPVILPVDLEHRPKLQRIPRRSSVIMSYYSFFPLY